MIALVVKKRGATFAGHPRGGELDILTENELDSSLQNRSIAVEFVLLP